MIHHVYIDAENHFLRTCDAAKRVLDNEKAPEILATADLNLHGGGEAVPSGRKAKTGGHWVYDRDLMLLWEFGLVHRRLGYRQSRSADFNRVWFVAPCSGDADAVHAMQVGLRDYGFDPMVIDEKGDYRRARENKKSDATNPLLDKAKGCDIALATQMVVEASNGLFDECHLFTSDADFLPAVRAVRALGKRVTVYGVKSNLPPRSRYLHECDEFVDIEARIRETIESSGPTRVKRAIEEVAD